MCVWWQLQVCYTCADKSACRWALGKSSIALHGVGATAGSHGEINLWLWSANSAPFWLQQLKRYIGVPRIWGQAMVYMAFPCCLGTSGLLSLVHLGRFFWSGSCSGCNWEFFICVSLSCQIVDAEVGKKILWWCSSCIIKRVQGNLKVVQREMKVYWYCCNLNKLSEDSIVSGEYYSRLKGGGKKRKEQPDNVCQIRHLEERRKKRNPTKSPANKNTFNSFWPVIFRCR